MRNTMHTASARRAATRGFTLTEIAIVLGIIGLILGAIWVAAAAVYSNMRTSKATTQLLQVTQAVRALYSTSSVTGAGAGNVNITADLIRAGVFPNDTVDITAGTVTNSFGGSIFVSSSTITTGGDAFSVLFSGVPQSGCIAMLVANTGSGRDPGMVGATAQATNYTAGSGVTFNATFNGLTVNQATGLCTAATGNTNGVGFLFRLKG